MKLDEIDLKALISTPERRAQFAQLCNRGLNTWDGAPQWLFELADAVAGDAKLQAAPQALNLADPAVQKRLAAQWGYVQQPAHGVGEVAADGPERIWLQVVRFDAWRK